MKTLLRRIQRLAALQAVAEPIQISPVGGMCGIATLPASSTSSKFEVKHARQ
jgi:hypothetical protein